jgi:lysophospholipase L1-like esterase
MTRFPAFDRQQAMLLLPLLVGCGALLQFATLWRGVRKARALAALGSRYERRLQGAGLRALILGDSTGVGVGASRPEESIAGLLAEDFPEADVINVSESGAKIADTLAQALALKGAMPRVHVAFLHVGGNDIVRGTPLDRLAEDCERLLVELTAMSDRVVWLAPPNIGIAPLFPPPYSWLIGARSRAASAVFAKCAARHGIAFVDLSDAEHQMQFVKARAEHFAIDRFHPSSSSYRYGYAVARRAFDFKASRGAATDGAVSSSSSVSGAVRPATA